MNWQLTRGEKIFQTVNALVLGLIAVSMIYPFIYIISISLSTPAEASRGGLHLFPREISLAAYKLVLSDASILMGLGNSTLRMVLGTVLTLVATCLAAYPLARPDMPHRSLLTFLILFTMVFTGGMVPNYLLIQELGLINSRWSLILPAMITAFNVIVVKNFFQAIPESLWESARLDGASEWTILFRIYIPLSGPVLATVALWTMVFHWNSWFDAMLYITDDSKQVLQIFLQRIVVDNATEALESGVSSDQASSFTPETIKAATVVVTLVPIMLVYPFLQRFFTKGIMLGSVKG